MERSPVCIVWFDSSRPVNSTAYDTSQTVSLGVLGVSIISESPKGVTVGILGVFGDTSCRTGPIPVTSQPVSFFVAYQAAKMLGKVEHLRFDGYDCVTINDLVYALTNGGYRRRGLMKDLAKDFGMSLNEFTTYLRHCRRLYWSVEELYGLRMRYETPIGLVRGVTLFK